jgi:hypothetical protein
LLSTARRSTYSSSPSQRGGALTVPPSKAVGRNSYQLFLGCLRLDSSPVEWSSFF